MMRDEPVRPKSPRGGVWNGSLEDRYRSLFLLGRGGMGRIEVAIDRGVSGGTERIVALKRLLPESARDPRRKEMFLREARLGALLAHPNVVRAFAFGEIYDELFLAMEYVEGEPLSRVLTAVKAAGRRLGAGLTCHVLAEVCEGLHAAHELTGADGIALNVVHRDVSPHNVMIGYDGQTKLLDFGVAKLDTAGHQTRTGEVKGKMAYMSPEQALGDRLDRRSDLFSLGAVLFECVTGRVMWGTGTDVELMRKLALERPPLLDAARDELPAGLAALHARLVSREPNMRPATAREVARELRALAVDLDTGDFKASLTSQMAALFGQVAADRRALLAEALAREAPSRVEALRRTLEPGALPDGPGAAEPVLVRARPPGRSARTTLAIAVGALTAVASAAVVGVATRRSSAMARSTSMPAMSVPTGPTHGAEPIGVPSLPVATASPTRDVGANESGPPPHAPAPANASRPAARPPASATSRASQAPPTTKAHDVDPAPF
jgi:hypothetical protein